MVHAPRISHQQRQRFVQHLLQLTQLPTASGREQAVDAWIERWAAALPDLFLDRDRHGNITIYSRISPVNPGHAPVYFTAHMDHPAFVVERVVAPSVVELSFRGGVMNDYFKDAAVVVHTATGVAHPARLFGTPRTDALAREGYPSSAGVFQHYMAELTHSVPAALSPAVGDVAVWDVGPAEVIDGICHTLACDDLAALAAAVSAFECLPFAHLSAPVRLLFTRAEEVGFVGAIGACRDGTIEKGARVIALENSRSFSDSPVGGGPIVRVGDRLSIFSPGLTDAVAKRAEQVAAQPRSTHFQSPSDSLAAKAGAGSQQWKWQRKLMAGGACEASVFCAFGYEATCVCLPLGNYHNMASLTEVQAGNFIGQPRLAREFISVEDYHGLIDLLVAIGIHLPASDGASAPLARFNKLWADRSFVL